MRTRQCLPMGTIGAFSALPLDRLPARSFRSAVPMPSNSARPTGHHNPRPDRPVLTRPSCGLDAEGGRLGSPEPPAGTPLSPERDPALGHRASRGSLPGIQSDTSAVPQSSRTGVPMQCEGPTVTTHRAATSGRNQVDYANPPRGSAAACFSFRPSNPSPLALLQLRIVVALTVQSSDT